MSSEESTMSPTSPENKELDQQNVVSRVASLPLIGSTYDMVSSAYASTKETHPYLKSVCSVAEKGVKTITAVAVSGAQPLLSKLEPQIATANEYACKGLDKLEEKLPILQQPSEKVVAETRELVSTTVTGARDVVSSTVNGAKNAVTSGVSRVVDLGKGAVHGSVEMTRSVVAGGVNTVRESRVGQMVATGMGAVLEKSEELVDVYLPITDQELAEVASSMEGVDLETLEGLQVTAVELQREDEGYFVRLGSLSAKFRHRAYLHALNKLRSVKQGTEDLLFQLQQTILLIEHVKLGGQEKQCPMELEWNRKPLRIEDHLDSSVQPEVESRTLAMFRGLTQQLHLSCSTMMSSIRGLPASIQDKVQQVRHTVEDLHSSFSAAHSFQDVPATILAQSRERVSKARESMDEMLEYVVQNVPLPWLVGPFAPNLVELPEASSNGTEKAESDLQAQKEPSEKSDSQQEPNEKHHSPQQMSPEPKEVLES
ncbi:perilipin-3-like [Hemicordylus capensis]|uniref:perilipin-3-like n=1 Tax=Hemicordylus capensis TaxID=884348 RepID=UPI0023043C5F|nr:perilipin-3-like [Hemicordylus capensis]XP_053154360.1 perilipin-3-like [Hemicordylus capensis]XP_053154362.1 perilipin-3-like [Hemicordylus capensis]XP_053154363.1 perilipin-3-like [Hemicordylus capensis]